MQLGASLKKVGLEKILFKQFEVFGSARAHLERFGADRILKSKIDKSLLDWMSKRFVSICYLALVDFTKIKLKPTQFLQSCTVVAGG